MEAFALMEGSHKIANPARPSCASRANLGVEILQLSPGLLSTKILWASISAAGCPTIRAIMLEPPSGV